MKRKAQPTPIDYGSLSLATLYTLKFHWEDEYFYQQDNGEVDDPFCDTIESALDGITKAIAAKETGHEP